MVLSEFALASPVGAQRSLAFANTFDPLTGLFGWVLSVDSRPESLLINRILSSLPNLGLRIVSAPSLAIGLDMVHVFQSRDLCERK